MFPKVSIITISFNAADVIEKTILSVINQSYKNIEYIIIDGGSTDGTINIIKKYTSKITYWCSELDKGIYDAMNKGIKKATGEWINFMNAGDSFFQNDTIELFINQIPPDTDIAYGDTMLNLSIGDYIEKPKPLDQIINGMVFGHQATFIRTELHKKYPFDRNYRSSGDYNFFYNVFIHKHRFSYIPMIVVNYEGENGISARNQLLSQKENASIQGKDKKILWRISYLILKIKLLIKSLLPLTMKNYLRKRSLSHNKRYQLYNLKK